MTRATFSTDDLDLFDGSIRSGNLIEGEIALTAIPSVRPGSPGP